MKRALIPAVVFMLTIMPIQVFCQSSNAALSGIVTDATGAALPGVAVTATSYSTAVAIPTRTNAAGAYSFPSLQPGTYEITAELSGFQKASYIDVVLGGSGQARLDFHMELHKEGMKAPEPVSASLMLLNSSSSAGLSHAENWITQLPLIGNNAFALLKATGGVLLTDQNPVTAADTTSVTGISAADVNVQRDGITVNDVRYPTGLSSPVHINTDIVGEFNVLLSPVDAELGRGNGQVQLVQKSGGNDFHGSLVWSMQNSGLDANEYHFNRTETKPDRRNVHEYTASFSGPIVKDKTYFFALWNHQIIRKDTTVNTTVLTPCARKGIFRYYDNWMSTNIDGAETNSGVTPTRVAVDADGTPVAPRTNPNGIPFTGKLRTYYVFGKLSKNPVSNDCSDFSETSDVSSGSYWDPYRKKLDPSGFITRFNDTMPKANNYEIGDGLNTAGYRWTRKDNGDGNLYGIGEDSRRKQINVRIDHYINLNHRISGSFSSERSTAPDSPALWTSGYGGTIVRTPKMFSANLTSVIRPSLVNEFRVGLSRTDGIAYDAINNPDTGAKMRSLLQTLLPTSDFKDYKDLPIVISPGAGKMGFYTNTSDVSGATPSNPFGSNGPQPVTAGGHDPRWTFGDSMTWTKGRHIFRGGIEFRTAQSYQQRNGNSAANVYVSAVGGATAFSAVQGISKANMTAIVGVPGSYGSILDMENLLNYFSGSIANIRQMLYVNSPNEKTWNDYARNSEDRQIFDIRLKEWDLFLKDEWKVTNSFTLNLGLRYENFGAPHVDSGMTVGLEGGSSAIFGISSRSFNNWLTANQTTGSNLTKLIFVGPNSPNSGQQVYDTDRSNFGPAVGFAWKLPWFGNGKTVLRGGYQLKYMPIGRADEFAGVIANTVGTSYTNINSGDSSHPYLDIAHLSSYVPMTVPSDAIPMATIPVTARNQSLSVYEQNLHNPYVQNLTLSLTRNIGAGIALDVRYIGALGRRQIGAVDINTPNFLTNGLKEAFDLARAGQESPLLDKMFNGINIQGAAGCGAVGTVCKGIPQTGAMQLRGSKMLSGSNATFQSLLANGQYAALASALAVANYATSFPGNSGLPAVAAGINGSILRHNNFAENFILTNPQFSSAKLLGNLNHNNYHALQAQITLRPTAGVSLVGTYTWSRNLGIAGSYANPLDRNADYSLVNGSRAHQLITYGSFDLPFGKNRLFLKNSPRALDAVVGGWQLGWIANIATGSPNSITANQTLYANGSPDFVGPKGSFDTKMGHVTWEPNASSGNYFENKFVKVVDPQCASVTTAQGLQSACTLQALALASDASVIVFQNAQPGTQGSFGQNNISNPMRWSLDAVMSKTVRISDSKLLQFRMDVANVLNHPQASLGYTTVGSRLTIANNPDFNLSGTNPFGYLNNKVGSRTIQIKARFDF